MSADLGSSGPPRHALARPRAAGASASAFRPRDGRVIADAKPGDSNPSRADNVSSCCTPPLRSMLAVAANRARGSTQSEVIRVSEDQGTLEERAPWSAAATLHSSALRLHLPIALP
jgi:hypothetical protein